VKPSQTSTPIETFTINISDIATSAANIELAWENTVAKFRAEFDVDSKVMAAIRKSTENPYASVAGMYYQSASYYFETQKDLNIALDWVNKSLEINKKPYWVWRLKSQIQAALKDYKGAITSAEMSKERAKEAKNEQMVKINEDAIAEWKAMK
jgi:tetratricopeptide (TPR) repeat protein